MSKNDVHFKEIMKMYDRGGSFTKKKVAVVVCRNSKASRRDIEEELLDTNYQDIVQYQDELNIKESVEGDRIQKLNDRIKALRDKMNSTKSSTQKNLIQQRLKNALQTLTKIKSGLGIKKINNESVNEAASRTAMEIGALTGTSKDFIQSFVDKHNLDIEKVFQYVKKGKLKDRMDFVTAVVGKDNNTYQTKLIKQFKESVNEAQAKYDVYHNSYTSAIQSAREYAEKQGYTINDDDSFTKIGLGPRKPSEGKTNRFSIELFKDGKVQRKMLQIQVYGMRNKYELNCYIG
jgi:hypothetical protein